jgi:hypothetical protein
MTGVFRSESSTGTRVGLFHAFVKDMHAYIAERNPIKRDELAARQVWLLSQHLGPREKPLKLTDVREMFVQLVAFRCGWSVAARGGYIYQV